MWSTLELQAARSPSLSARRSGVRAKPSPRGGGGGAKWVGTNGVGAMAPIVACRPQWLRGIEPYRQLGRAPDPEVGRLPFHRARAGQPRHALGQERQGLL